MKKKLDFFWSMLRSRVFFDAERSGSGSVFSSSYFFLNRFFFVRIRIPVAQAQFRLDLQMFFAHGMTIILQKKSMIKHIEDYWNVLFFYVYPFVCDR